MKNLKLITAVSLALLLIAVACGGDSGEQVVVGRCSHNDNTRARKEDMGSSLLPHIYVNILTLYMYIIYFVTIYHFYVVLSFYAFFYSK